MNRARKVTELLAEMNLDSLVGMNINELNDGYDEVSVSSADMLGDTDLVMFRDGGPMDGLIGRVLKVNDVQGKDMEKTVDVYVGSSIRTEVAPKRLVMLKDRSAK